MAETAVFSRTLLVTCADLATTHQTQSRISIEHDLEEGHTSFAITGDGGKRYLQISPSVPFIDFLRWYFELPAWDQTMAPELRHEIP